MVGDISSRKNILLVDDDQVHLHITKTALKDEYEVFMVKSGKDALEFLNKKQIIPDLILLDIMMPEMDGWVVYENIQNIAELEFTPIIFYSSLDDESTIEKAYELGIFDYITKPCNMTVLQNRVKEILSKAELRKQQFGGAF
ncbi:MAG: response regulator [Treponema sp.]|nr:response regulator [Treponema sp.]